MILPVPTKSSTSASTKIQATDPAIWTDLLLLNAVLAQAFRYHDYEIPFCLYAHMMDRRKLPLMLDAYTFPMMFHVLANTPLGPVACAVSGPLTKSLPTVRFSAICSPGSVRAPAPLPRKRLPSSR